MPGQPDEVLATFTSLRPRLFGIAYRMLGTKVEAEDLLQEVWLRWQAADHAAVNDAPAFLATITTRLALNFSQSAQVRRSHYVGPWLPEPVDTSADPSLGAERGEALELAVLMLLEKLTPTERAAYVLREAFDYEFSAIASGLEISEANARQLSSRARKHLADERKKPVGPDAQRRLLEAFMVAAQRGDRSALERLFAPDVVSTSDGGGVARASRIPVIGRETVAQFVAGFASHFWNDTTLRWITANGASAVVISRAGVAIAMATLEGSDEGITRLFWVMNPAKLGAIGSASELERQPQP